MIEMKYNKIEDKLGIAAYIYLILFTPMTIHHTYQHT